MYHSRNGNRGVCRRSFLVLRHRRAHRSMDLGRAICWLGRLHRRMHAGNAMAVAVAASDRSRPPFGRRRRIVGGGHGRAVRVLRPGPRSPRKLLRAVVARLLGRKP